MNYLKFHLPFPLYYGINIFVLTSIVFIPLVGWARYTHPERASSLLVPFLIILGGSLFTILAVYFQQRLATWTGYHPFIREFENTETLDTIEQKMISAITKQGFRILYRHREKGFLAETDNSQTTGNQNNFSLRMRFHKHQTNGQRTGRMILEIKGFVLKDTGERRYVEDVGMRLFQKDRETAIPRLHATSSTSQKSLPQKDMKLLGQLEGVCTFLIAFSGIKYMLGEPAKTSAQLIYRSSLFLVGLIGFITIALIKRHRRRQTAESEQTVSCQEGENSTPMAQEAVAHTTAQHDETATQYRVLFGGEIANGHQLQDVKTNVARLYKVPISRCERFFTGKPVVIKDKVTYQVAQKYKRAFEKTGAICQIQKIL